MKEKSNRVKNLRLTEFKSKAAELDEKERELCRKTNQLVDALISKCDDSPFQQALIDILGNFKGIDLKTILLLLLLSSLSLLLLLLF